MPPFFPAIPNVAKNSALVNGWNEIFQSLYAGQIFLSGRGELLSGRVVPLPLSFPFQAYRVLLQLLVAACTVGLHPFRGLELTEHGILALKTGEGFLLVLYYERIVAHQFLGFLGPKGTFPRTEACQQKCNPVCSGRLTQTP